MTLIELMVSLALGLILLLGMTSLFVNQSRSQANLDRIARLTENGRYALQVIADDLQMAGYYGNLSADPTTSTDWTIPADPDLPDPCATAVGALGDGTLLDDLVNAMPFHVQGYDNLAATTLSDCVDDIVPGTDVLVIRRVNTNPVNAATLAAGNTTRYLQSTTCQFDPGPGYVLDTVPASFTYRDINCDNDPATVDPLADVNRFLVRIYYIAANYRDGDGVPTLKRAELNALGNFDTVVSLAEGIENLQVQYGVDNNADGVPDTFCSAGCATANWPNIVSARVHLLARTVEPVPSYENFADNKTYTLGDKVLTAPADLDPDFKRRVYSEYVGLMNR